MLDINNLLETRKINLIVGEDLHVLNTKANEIRFLEIYTKQNKKVTKLFEDDNVKKILGAGFDILKVAESEILSVLSADEMLKVIALMESIEPIEKNFEKELLDLINGGEKSLKNLYDLKYKDELDFETLKDAIVKEIVKLCTKKWVDSTPSGEKQ